MTMRVDAFDYPEGSGLVSNDFGACLTHIKNFQAEERPSAPLKIIKKGSKIGKSGAKRYQQKGSGKERGHRQPVRVNRPPARIDKRSNIHPLC